MPARKGLDHRIGPMPEIRADGDSVSFWLDIAGLHQSVRLVIRCDAAGNVWASLTPRTIHPLK